MVDKLIRYLERLSSRRQDRGVELPRWCSDKQSACQCRRHKRCGFYPWVGKIPWRRKWQPTPVFLYGEFCQVVRIGKRSPKWQWLKDRTGKACESRAEEGPRTGVRASGRRALPPEPSFRRKGPGGRKKNIKRGAKGSSFLFLPSLRARSLSLPPSLLPPALAHSSTFFSSSRMDSPAIC